MAFSDRLGRKQKISVTQCTCNSLLRFSDKFACYDKREIIAFLGVSVKADGGECWLVRFPERWPARGTERMLSALAGGLYESVVDVYLCLGKDFSRTSVGPMIPVITVWSALAIAISAGPRFAPATTLTCRPALSGNSGMPGPRIASQQMNIGFRDSNKTLEEMSLCPAWPPRPPCVRTCIPTAAQDRTASGVTTIF